MLGGIYESTKTVHNPESLVDRPQSECYDVMLTFFDPSQQFERARKVYRLTVDVSGVCPVTLDPVRSWFAR